MAHKQWLWLASIFALISVALARTSEASAQSGIVAWGDNAYGQCNVPAIPSGLTCVEIAAGENHGLARLSDGSVTEWGLTQASVPLLPNGVTYVEIAAGGIHSLARRSDGSVVAWGDNTYGQCNVPVLAPGLAYVAISAGYYHSVAVLSDGSIVAWGDNSSGQCNLSSLPTGVSGIQPAAGGLLACGPPGGGGCWELGSTLVRCSDGTVVEWGDIGNTNSVPALPSGVSYVELATSASFAVARRSDGSVVQWAFSWGAVPTLPPGFSYVEISAGASQFFWQGPPILLGHAIARRSDGSAVAWGDNTWGQCNVPALAPGLTYSEVAAGGKFTVARFDAAPACGSLSLYCSPPRPNSASPHGASLTVDGCPGVSANNLVLHVSGLPPGKPGLFIYGATQQQTPFGNGWGCISGSVQRVQPALLSSPGGTVNFPVNLTQFPFTGSANPILPSSDWNFQFWYRDPQAAPSGFNLSDAVHISFAP